MRPSLSLPVSLVFLSGLVSPVLSQQGIEYRGYQDNMPSNSKFRRRSEHAIAVLGSHLYIEGGEMLTYVNGSSSALRFLTFSASLPLNRSWTSASMIDNVRIIPRGDKPIIKATQLWVDETRNRIFQWCGDGPNRDGARDRSLWEFSADGGGGGIWTKRRPSESVFRNARGMITTCNGRGYILGGYVTGNSDDRVTAYTPTPGLVSYDLATGNWANETVPKEFYPNRRDGQAHCLPFGGQPGAGLVLFLGGADYPSMQLSEANLLSLDRITIYDPSRKEWHEQMTTGGPPERRILFCSAGVSNPGKNSSTYEIIIYGGINRGISTKEPLSDIWVLTIPGFHWTKANVTGSPRSHHECTTIGGRQMISVGGLAEIDYRADLTTSDDPWTQGIGLLDLKTLTWQPGFEPNGVVYEPPDSIKTWYDNGGLEKVQWKSDGLKALFVNNTSDASVISTKPSSPESSGTSGASTPVAAIVGGTLGGLGLAAVIASVGIYIIRRRKQQAVNKLEFLQDKHDDVAEVPAWREPAELHETPLKGELPPSSMYDKAPVELPSNERA